MLDDAQMLERIESNPGILTGKPVVRGTRLSVEFIVSQLAHGRAIPDLLEEYSHLTQEDVKACLLYAARNLSACEFADTSGGTR